MSMRWLLFLSRVAFICGIFFILFLGASMIDWTEEKTVTKAFLFVGYVLGALMIPLVCFCYLVVQLVTRKLRKYVPRWLTWSNLVFLFLLLFYIFYLNDPYYH